MSLKRGLNGKQQQVTGREGNGMSCSGTHIGHTHTNKWDIL